jgi:hypothetical protein
MAKRVFLTPSTAYAVSAFNAATTQWMAVKGGAATQIIDFLEFLISGMASASAPGEFTVAFSSTLGATVTTLATPGSDGPMNVNATALANPTIPYFAATTGPFPSNSAALPKINLGLNAFGGIIRWNAAPTQQWTSVGNATNGGETVLWNYAGSGSVTAQASAHIIYEPY